MLTAVRARTRDARGLHYCLRGEGMGSVEVTTVAELLARARSRLERLDPGAARDAVGAGAVLVDIRSEAQRGADGVVPGSVFIPRNVLEWRCDPASDWRDARVAAASRVVLMCDEGYQSSLAAATLRDFGLDATDVEGGFQAWRAAGLPLEPDVRRHMV